MHQRLNGVKPLKWSKEWSSMFPWHLVPIDTYLSAYSRTCVSSGSEVTLVGWRGGWRTRFRLIQVELSKKMEAVSPSSDVHEDTVCLAVYRVYHSAVFLVKSGEVYLYILKSHVFLRGLTICTAFNTFYPHILNPYKKKLIMYHCSRGEIPLPCIE